MESLVFSLDGPNNGAKLCLRRRDLDHTSHETLFSLPMSAACAICGPHTGIPARFSLFADEERIEKKDLKIERIAAREPGGHVWAIRIGDHLVMRPARDTATATPLLISDAAVRCLQRHAHVIFESGQPDWDLREIELLEDQIFEMRMGLADREEQLALLRATYAAAHDPAQGCEA